MSQMQCFLLFYGEFRVFLGAMCQPKDTFTIAYFLDFELKEEFYLHLDQFGLIFVLFHMLFPTFLKIFIEKVGSVMLYFHH